jgi:hypothetical protein
VPVVVLTDRLRAPISAGVAAPPTVSSASTTRTAEEVMSAVGSPTRSSSRRGASRVDYSALNKKGTSPGALSKDSKTEGSPSAEEGINSSKVGMKYSKPQEKKEHTDWNENAVFEIQKVVKENMCSFKCPLHCCYNCVEYYGAVDGSDLVPCIACPRAYHSNCKPPGSRYNSVCFLCPLHPDLHLPAQDGVKASKEALESRAVFTNFFDMLLIPDSFPDAKHTLANHFKLPKQLKEEVESAPQNFKMISRNIWDFMAGKNLPPSYLPTVSCECKNICDENCLNRVLRIECCDTKIKATSECGSSDKGICAVGPGCTNRQIGSRKYAKHEVFKEFQMGYGLRTTEFTPKGALVLEYVGEVIDYPEVHRRMTQQRLLTPLDRDFYIMELDNGIYVDGKFKGSNSRYINHSCDPNCELQRWVVNGGPRIGIFAITDIPAGTPLSYDYQFDTKEEEAFKCYCGKEKCRGSMAPKKKKALVYDANGRLQSKEERDRLIALGQQRLDELNSLDNLVDAEWSRSLTSNMLPGDVINEVKNGPPKAAVQAGRAGGILLARSAYAGSNFFKRKERLERRMAAEAAATGGGGGARADSKHVKRMASMSTTCSSGDIVSTAVDVSVASSSSSSPMPLPLPLPLPGGSAPTSASKGRGLKRKESTGV